MLALTVNGEQKLVIAPQTLQEFLEANNLLLPFMAVARNGEVLHRSEYATVLLRDGDRLEIVRMVGGG
ncbi:MAG: sulfur carrier protein ThiS [Chloroflexi bacterium]|nr:sulfur carrier protein ThiS [Chloroflexota bacterium]